MPTRRRAVTSMAGESVDGSEKPHNHVFTSASTSLAQAVLDGIHQRANPQTKAWFTNCVKGTTWVGCKMPVVREALQEATGHNKALTNKSLANSLPSEILLDAAVALLQHEVCDVKLGGILMLSEQMQLEDLATHATLQRLEDEVLLQNKLDDWSSADWFALKVLQKIVFAGGEEPVDNDAAASEQPTLSQRVLNYTNIIDTPNRNYFYVRRCGVVPFLDYHKHRHKLTPNFGHKLVDACERSLLASPKERFTQTAITWVLRYVLLQAKEKDKAFQMIAKHGGVWTKEAKKSLTEKLSKNDPRRKKILEL